MARLMANLSLRSPIVSLAAGMVVTVLFLHVVVFRGRSLLSADYTSVLHDETVKDLPTALWRIGNTQTISYRRHDIGSSAWQFGPSLHFMTRAIWEGQTPY